MLQIAAEELDVAPERILLQTGDTDLTPNEGYTAGSQSIQFGGVALRMACAEVRALFLDHAAATLRLFARRPGGARRRDHPSRRADRPGLLVARRRGRSRRATPPARPPIKSVERLSRRRAERAARRSRRQGVRRAGLCPRHGARRHGACARRAPAAPRRDDRHDRRGRAAPRRERADRDRPRRQFPGDSRRRRDGRRSRRRRRARIMSPGTGSTRSTRSRKRRAGCCSSPRSTATIGPPPLSDPAPAARRHEATYTRMHIAHASVAPSCGLAVYRDGRLTVWTHSQGVYPLRDALARTLKLDPAAISVQARAGAGLLRP